MENEIISQPNNQEEDFSDLNGYIMKEMKILKRGLNKYKSPTETERSDKSVFLNHNQVKFFKEFRKQIAEDDCSNLNSLEKQEETLGSVSTKFKSSNLETNNIQSLFQYSVKNERSPDRQYYSVKALNKKLSTHINSPAYESCKHSKKKTCPNKESELQIQSVNEDDKIKKLEKELINSGNRLLMEHLVMFKSSLNYLVCTQGGSRCLQSAFLNSEKTMLDKFALEEVSSLPNNYYFRFYQP